MHVTVLGICLTASHHPKLKLPLRIYSHYANVRIEMSYASKICPKQKFYEKKNCKNHFFNFINIFIFKFLMPGNTTSSP